MSPEIINENVGVELEELSEVEGPGEDINNENQVKQKNVLTLVEQHQLAINSYTRNLYQQNPYYRFMDVHRESVRKLNPDETGANIAKLINAKWRGLPRKIKNLYGSWSKSNENKSKKQLNLRYTTESENNLSVPLKTISKRSKQSNNVQNSAERLSHRNTILKKKIQELGKRHKKITEDNNKLQKENSALKEDINNKKVILVNAFANISIPTEQNGCRMENIDKYFKDLCRLMTSKVLSENDVKKVKKIMNSISM